MLSADYICKQFGPRPGPTKWKMLYVGPDLDPSCLTLIVFLKQFFKKSDFEKKNQQTTESMLNFQFCLFFVALRPKSTAMGMAGRSVHL